MRSSVASRAAGAADPGARFRRAEAAVWNRYGLRLIDRSVDIARRPALRLQVSEVGTGRPILLVHGTVGPAAWAPLVAAKPDAGRFIVLDRPGWGGSDPLDFQRDDYHAVSGDLLAGVLDRLGIERATVIGGSIGDVWALSLAERHPSRVDRVALLGAGPLLAGVRPPSFIRLLSSPLGALIVRLPVSPGRARSMLADSGHAASLADGRIPPEFIDYRVSLSNDTRAMRHERDMVRHLVRGPGWRPDLPFDEPALGRIAAPTLMVVGSADDVGDPGIWRTFMAAMPDGRFALVEGAGHMPWFDAPDEVAGHLHRFLGS